MKKTFRFVLLFVSTVMLASCNFEELIEAAFDDAYDSNIENVEANAPEAPAAELAE